MSNKPRVHYDLIKAWANGDNIECWDVLHNEWYFIEYPTWSPSLKYRISSKPIEINKRIDYYIEIHGPTVDMYDHDTPNVRFAFDPKTKQLVHVEIIKYD